nr:integrase, catalytic region, zinc finger, CCHC-type, peptidase aspartic, catalytic [Tanacetum cinerariifolium]
MTQQSQAKFPQLDSSLVVPMFQQGEDLIKCINKAMVFLSAVASRFSPLNNQLKTSSNPINQATIQNDPGISEALVTQQTIPQNLAFQTDDLDSYDSNCDDLSSAKAVLMANISSCNPEFLFKSHKMRLFRMHRSRQAMHMLTKPQVFYDDTQKQALGYQNSFHLKKAQRIQPTLYDGSVIAKEHAMIYVNDDEETLILEEKSRSKMLDKQMIQIFKLDIKPISARLKNNKDAHEVYIGKTIEYVDTLCGFVERIVSLCLSNMPNSPKPSEKLGYPDRPLVSGLWMFKTYDKEPLSTHELCVDQILGSRDTNLYTISLDDMLKTSPICLLSKALKTKSWLWHHRLSHLNFGTLNKLAKDGLTRAPEDIIKCIKNIQVRLNATVQNVRTDNGTEFINQTLQDFYENVGISHQTFVARKTKPNSYGPKQSTTPLFLCAKAINKACYTQNRSLIRLRYNKTPYELMHNKKPDLLFFHVFGSLCYPTNDNKDLGKLNGKADIGIFVGYTPTKKAFRIYNRRIQKIIETIHVTFDELTSMASKQSGLGPGLQVVTPFNIQFRTLPVADAPRAVEIADSPMYMSIDQDAPSSSIPSTQDQEHSPIISQGVEESPKTPLFHDDPLHKFVHEDSTSQGSSFSVRPSHTLFKLIGRWTKDHPIESVIDDPSRLVSTIKKLKTDSMWCYFDAFLTFVEPKNFKQAMTEPSWIDAMHD